MKKNMTFTFGALIIGSLLLTAGCSQKETRLDQSWGTSYNLAKYNQIVDLEAPADNEPKEGVEANVSAKVLNTYTNSFGKQEQKAKTYSVAGK
ncbi:MAG: hypothetical protein ACI8PB_002600 [Desulforhopalus sp.]|jgi:hypothetical protein